MVVEGAQVAVGDMTAGAVGHVRYEVLCRRHYMRGMTSHTARTPSISPEVLPFALDFRPIPVIPAQE
jgi:thymidine kinase